MRVIFRADASVMIGTGHVMRCLTLAEVLRDAGASCAFVIRNHLGHLGDWIAERGFDVKLLDPPIGQGGTAPPVHASWAGVPWQQDAEETRAVMGVDVDWLVVDHYAFDACWQRAVAGSEMRIMVIDDLADRPHEADLLLDQNLGREASDYDGLVPERCQRLIGPRYALLRPEFAAARAASLAGRLGRPLRHILITMGGTDAIDATSYVLDALRGAALPDDAHLTVVMGRNAPALARVQSFAAEMPWPTEVAVDVADMAELMAEADLAVGAGGGTTWERCCMGLPSIIVQTADNQKELVRALVAQAVSPDVGPLQSDDFPTRLRMAIEMDFHGGCNLDQCIATAALHCDGKGALQVRERLVLAVNSRTDAHNKPVLKVRSASFSDMHDVWLWRNVGVTLSHYRSKAAPSLASHAAWFRAALDDSRRWMAIVEVDKVPAAHVRFDRVYDRAGLAEVSIYLNPAFRGRGLGRHVLRAAIAEARNRDLTCFCAEAHTANGASRRIFADAGFREIGMRECFVQMEQIEPAGGEL
jgi:UDP-2,4-diacetamido-2,4,6-trideoxy-beta-L-altropyranose hydrolase